MQQIQPYSQQHRIFAGTGAWPISSLGLTILVALSYFLAARLSLALLTPSDGVAVFWPAAGISSGLLIALGPPSRLPVVAGVAIASMAANLLGDRNLASSAVFTLCNVGEAMLLAALIERHFGAGFRLDSVRRVFGFFIAAGLAVAVSGLGGTTAFVLFHDTAAPALSTWFNWFASGTVGAVAVAPLVIGLAHISDDLPDTREMVEGLLTLAVLVVAATISFGFSTAYWFTILPLALLLPLLIWLAARCPAVFAAAGVCVLALIIVWTVTFGIGRLGDVSVPLCDRVHAARAVLLGICACALVLAALFEETRRQEAALKEANERVQLRIPIIPYPAPLTDEQGNIVGVVSLKIDISERKRTEAALAERNAQFALATKAALVGSYTHDYVTGVVTLSPGSAAIYGLPEDTVVLSRDQSRALIHPDDLGSLRAEFRRAIEQRRTEIISELRIVRADNGEIRWIETRNSVSYDGTGLPSRMTGVSIDISARKESEDHKALLIAELDHRVKNVLACVTAIAQHASESSRTRGEFIVALNGRIQSLANAHTLLSKRRWHSVDLAELVRAELAPCSRENNTVMEGGALGLNPDAAQTVAMVLHELATNAAKYGALSSNTGRVSVRWRCQSNGTALPGLILEWQEMGGPPVRPGGGSGYGTSVIRDLIPYELGGSVDYVQAPGGIHCVLKIPSRWLALTIRPQEALNGAEGRSHQAM
jgi:PAS domain S-box-containing protein